jgi:hypothetical protein
MRLKIAFGVSSEPPMEDIRQIGSLSEAKTEHEITNNASFEPCKWLFRELFSLFYGCFFYTLALITYIIGVLRVLAIEMCL